jgi:hypothetical protein
MAIIVGKPNVHITETAFHALHFMPCISCPAFAAQGMCLRAQEALLLFILCYEDLSIAQ